jgi:ATP phosphoribosyltransferase
MTGAMDATSPTLPGPDAQALRSDPPLSLAVPSKGRLQENTSAFFARAGLPLQQGRGARDYRGTIAGMEDVEVLFLSASEIARELAQGGAHLGITGEDLLRESIPEAEGRVAMLTPLGFGHANVVVAVPQAWIDVRGMADLEDVASTYRIRHGRKMRVATKYLNLTRRFFAGHGIADYRLVESLGATEGAPASGTADLIVDITTTGATLAANALKIVEDGVILRSEANLVASVGAAWGPRARKAARSMLARIAAEETARTTREVRATVPREAHAMLAEMPAAWGVSLLSGARAGEDVTFSCGKGTIFALAEWLVAQGAGRVSIGQQDYVYSASNVLAERLEARIGGA